MKYIYSGNPRTVAVGDSTVNLINGVEYPELIAKKFPNLFKEVSKVVEKEVSKVVKEETPKTEETSTDNVEEKVSKQSTPFSKKTYSSKK